MISLLKVKKKNAAGAKFSPKCADGLRKAGEGGGKAVSLPHFPPFWGGWCWWRGSGGLFHNVSEGSGATPVGAVRNVRNAAQLHRMVNVNSFRFSFPGCCRGRAPAVHNRSTDCICRR